MMTPVPTQAARTILGIEVGSATSAQQLAAGLASSCERLTAHLSPVIGEIGMHAIFKRALVIAAVNFPWVAAATSTSPERDWATLRTVVEGQELDVAFAGAVSLLAHIISLLGRFIGDALAARLLHDLWPTVFVAKSPKELT